MKRTSRIPGFHREGLDGRLRHLVATGLLSPASQAHLLSGGQVDPSALDRMSENVLAGQCLPLSVALNFQVNGRDVLVPMAVEEPSVVAAASSAARLVRASGGFVGSADEPVMTAQVQLDAVPKIEQAISWLESHRAAILAQGNAVIPKMVGRGGGCRSMEVRVLDVEQGLLVVHIYVAVGDAMGANVVDQVAEAVAPIIKDGIGGTVGLRILSNLPLQRMVRVTAQVNEDVLGPGVAARIAAASRFAELDPFRAVTHNKGVMNGIDAVAVALGQDFRALEAGAHGYAALSGRYRPIASWTHTEPGLFGQLEMPLACGSVGGSTGAHQGIRAAFELVSVSGAKELAVVMGAAGLACNLAALRALTGPGIQAAHMGLHRRKEAGCDR